MLFVVVMIYPLTNILYVTVVMIYPLSNILYVTVLMIYPLTNILYVIERHFWIMNLEQI